MLILTLSLQTIHLRLDWPEQHCVSSNSRENQWQELWKLFHINKALDSRSTVVHVRKFQLVFGTIYLFKNSQSALMLLITLRGLRMVEKSNSNPSLQRVSIRALELNHWRPVFKFIWCCRCLIWETNLWRTVFGFRFMGCDWWFDSD